MAQIDHNGPVKNPSKQTEYLKSKMTQPVYSTRDCEGGKGNVKNILPNLRSRKDASFNVSRRKQKDCFIGYLLGKTHRQGLL